MQMTTKQRLMLFITLLFLNSLIICVLAQEVKFISKDTVALNPHQCIRKNRNDSIFAKLEQTQIVQKDTGDKLTEILNFVKKNKK